MAFGGQNVEMFDGGKPKLPPSRVAIATDTRTPNTLRG